MNKLRIKIDTAILVIEAFKKEIELEINKKISFDNFTDYSKINNTFNQYIEEIDNEEDKKTFINEVRTYFSKVIKVEAVAKEYTIEDWLDHSRNQIGQEKRFIKYKNALRKKGYDTNQLEAETEAILNSCHDPRLGGEWDRRGLVYGHVQSGKTSNYIGLINRALDHDYKIIIVLTGMTEDLRRQTQLRIKQGVVQIQGDKYREATNIEQDLSTHSDQRLKSLVSHSDKSIWVIKKNKTVLENLIKWLDFQRKEQGEEKLKDTPVLIIDDEADNASIQSMTAKEFSQWDEAIKLKDEEEEDLTDEEKVILQSAKENALKAINRNIRAFMSLISCKTFVAYTATPYNIVTQEYYDIERDFSIESNGYKISVNIDAGDLFPKHFIIPIQPNNKYVGINNTFNTDESKNIPIKINLNDSQYKDENLDEIFTTKRGENYVFEKIPKSLENAILYFITSIIIKKYRGINEFNTMLIHTSHLTSRIDYLKNKVDDFIYKNLKNELMISDDYFISKINRILNTLKEESKHINYRNYFDNEYIFPKSISSQEIIDLIEDPEIKLNVVSHHSSKSLDTNKGKLDYRGKIKNFIVIGGNRLSRGLTLEGLTTSYFVRKSTRQDSLYQMGRWFGYRLNYEDLIKVFMPIDQISHFESIYELENVLRNDFERNNDKEDPVLPEFAIIKLAYSFKDSRNKYPKLCDPSKLRKTFSMEVSHSGPIKTHMVQKDKKIQLSNFELCLSFINKLNSSFSKNHFDNASIKNFSFNNISFTDINEDLIIEFLYKFKFHPRIQSKFDTFTEFISNNKNQTNGWSVSLVNKKNNPEFNDPKIDVSHFYNSSSKTNLKSVKRSSDSGTTELHTSIIDGDARDTSFDLINDYKDFMEEIKQNSSTPEKYIQIKRNQLKKPLLLIYPVQDDDENTETSRFPLLYIFYPKINNGKKVRYIIRNKSKDQL